MKVHLGLAAALIVLIACLAMLIAGALGPADVRAAAPGSVAPDFSLRDAEDHPVALSELRGNVVIVYFRGQGSGDQNRGEQNGSDRSSCPTSAPTDSAANNPSLKSDDLAAQRPAASGYKSGHNTEIASAPDLTQLCEMCRAIHSPRVKVLDLESPLSVANANSVLTADQGTASSVKTLLDPAGEVAREYKIDQADAKPTVLVIDPAGVIRYRGNSLDDHGNAAANPLLAPAATQPSSCPKVIQALLSSTAMEINVPSSDGD